MRRNNSIRSVEDVVAHGLCIGCGACVHVLGQEVAHMVDDPDSGLHPQLLRRLSPEEASSSLSVCPGIRVQMEVSGTSRDPIVGRERKVWVGHASDPEIRLRASSGGAITALCTYCLEESTADFVAHTGMDESEPWRNVPTISRSPAELIRHTGSRYAPSSPCELLTTIRLSKEKAVFVGKPCDVAALRSTCRAQPDLLDRIPVVISFFCAGTPSSRSVYKLAERARDGNVTRISQLHFRGNGWPGHFRTRLQGGKEVNHYTYTDSWAELQSSRGLRCRLCADGMGELADVSCGDAWHRYTGDDNPGLSIVVARTERGVQIVESAIRLGYLNLTQVDPYEVRQSQGTKSGIAHRRQASWGRLFALRILGVPAPVFVDFPLRAAWKELPLPERVRAILGTFVRAVKKRWGRVPVRHG